jgi:hypothetical protein
MSGSCQSFGVARRVHLLTHHSEHRLRALLLRDSGESFVIEFRARPPVSLRVLTVQGRSARTTASVSHCWPMTRAPQLHAWTRDPFVRATQWAYRAMYPRRDVEGSDEDPDAPATMRALFGACAGLEQEAAALCDPAARAIAMRFPPHLRLWLYGRLVDDSTGRIAQLASACPGALTFAYGLQVAGAGWGSPADEAGARLLGAAVAGRRLDWALRDAVEEWATAMECSSDASGRVDPVWDRLRWAFGAERERLLSRQQLLLRRAGPMVATTNLFLPPPISFAPEDIPRKVRDNARWFSVMKCSRALIGASMRDERGRLEAFAMFVSRHAVALARAGSQRHPRAMVAHMRDYAVATDHWPVRGTSLRYLDEVALWHERVARVEGVAALAQLTPGLTLSPEVQLPAPPVGRWRDDGVEIAPLSSVGELVVEGHRMHHCVASRYQPVALGESAIYRATIGGKPITVEIERTCLRWRIKEAKGFGDREPTTAEWVVLRRWEATFEGTAPP